jgi:hypothetical protein
MPQIAPDRTVPLPHILVIAARGRSHASVPFCSVVLPAAADIVAVLLQSDALYPGYHPSDLKTARGTLIFPSTSASSSPSAPWATTHVSESLFLDKLVEKKAGAVLSRPQLVSTIDFCSPPQHGIHTGETLSMTVTSDGTLHAIAYWWDLKMCPGDENPLAAHPPPVSACGVCGLAHRVTAANQSRKCIGKYRSTGGFCHQH